MSPVPSPEFQMVPPPTILNSQLPPGPKEKEPMYEQQSYICLLPEFCLIAAHRKLLLELDWSVYTCLTQLYDGGDMYIVYYIKNNYMFRHLTLAIFRLINEKKNLVSSYTGLVWVVYSGEVRGEVGTRSGMCCVGWVVWVQGFCYCMLL